MPSSKSIRFLNKKYLVISSDPINSFEDIVYWRSLNPGGILFYDDGEETALFNFDSLTWEDYGANYQKIKDSLPDFMDETLFIDNSQRQDETTEYIGEPGAIKKYNAENWLGLPHDEENLNGLDKTYNDDLGRIRDFRDQKILGKHYTNYDTNEIYELAMPYMVDYYNKKTPGLNLILTDRDSLGERISELINTNVKSARLVVGRGHWVAVDFFVSDNGQVSIIEIDSVLMARQFLKEEISKYAPGAHVTSVGIDVQRQSYGCSIFSLELAKQIFYEHSSFENLHKLNIEGEFPAEGPGIFSESQIPASLMKHASSPNRLLNFIAENEQYKDQSINKKGETLLQRQSSRMIEEEVNGRNITYSNSIDEKAISIIGKVLAEFESPASHAQSEWYKAFLPEPRNGSNNTPSLIGSPPDQIGPKSIPTLQELAATALSKMPSASDTMPPIRGMPTNELGAVFSETLASIKVMVSGPAEHSGWKLKSILEIVDDRKATGTVDVRVLDTGDRQRTLTFSAEDFNRDVTEAFSSKLLEKTSSSLAKARLGLAADTSQGISESLGIYAMVKGITDFLQLSESGYATTEQLALNGFMAGWGGTELVGLNKLLTDAAGNAYRSIILHETESFANAGYPSGLDAAIGQTLSKLGKFAGLGEEATGLLSRIGSKVPLAAIALGGYALYSDTELIKHLKSEGASQGDIDKAIGGTVLDALSTAAFVVAPYSGPAAPFVAAFGMVLSIVRGALYETSLSSVSDVLSSFMLVGALPSFMENLRRLYGDGSFEATQTFRSQMDAMYDGNNPAFNKFVQVEQQANQRYLSFLAHDDQSALTKEASYYGNQYATLQENGRLTLQYWTPANSYSGDKYSFHGLKQGQVSGQLAAGDDSLIVIGVSTTATPRYNQLNGEMRYAGSDKLYGGDHMGSMGFVQSNIFGIQGNSHDNTFISVYNSTTPYRYNIKGGDGDDALIISNAGQYYFDGEGNGSNGDWLTSTGVQQPTNVRLLLSLVPLAVGAVGSLAVDQTDLAKARALPNLYVSLTAVENIHGSEKNEVFVGSDQANIIVTGGGDDKVYLSGGGDNYYVTANAATYVEIRNNGESSKTTLQDTVYLSNVSYDQLAWMYGALRRYYVELSSEDYTRVYVDGREVVSSDMYRPFIGFENLESLQRLEFVTSDGVRLRYVQQDDGSVKTFIVGCDITQSGPIGSWFKDTYLLDATQLTDKVFTTPTQGLAILDLGVARSWQQLLGGYIRSTVTNTGELCAVGSSGTFESIVSWDTTTTDFNRMVFKGGAEGNQWTLQMLAPQNGWMLSTETHPVGAVTSLLVEDAWGRYSLYNGQLEALELKHASQVSLVFLSVNDTLNIQRLSSLMTTYDVTVVGSDGNDIINGSASYATLTLYGGKGDDILQGSMANDVMYGGVGNDTFYTGKGQDAIDGGDGVDTVLYEQAQSGVIAQLLNTDLSKLLDVGGDYLFNIENLTGSRFDDFLIGNNQNNVIRGGMGDDVIIGGAGDDMLLGGDGNDLLYGGDGIDTVVYEGSDQGGVTVQLQELDGSLFLPLQNVGEAQGDQLFGIENLTGSRYDDLLIGNSQDNILSGGDGDDILCGAGGVDTLMGGGGDDVYVLAVGSRVHVSAIGNGEGMDILNFGAHVLPELSFFRENDDLHIKDQQGTDVMLDNWFKEQSRYELETSDDTLDNSSLVAMVHQWISYPQADDSVISSIHTQMTAVI